MKQCSTSLLSFLVLSLSIGYAPHVRAATELAKINSASITLEEFEKHYQDNLKFFQYKAPSKQEVLEDLIKRELGIQEAKKLGLDKDLEVIERMHTVLYQALLDRKLANEFKSISISDDEAKTFYEKNPEVRTSHVFVGVRAGAKPEEIKAAQDKIQKIMAEIRAAKMTFSEVAQRYSEGVAAPMGGDIDFQTRDKLDPAYYEAALKLKSAGKVSDVVRSSFGFHIIKLAAIKTWEEVDHNGVKRALFEKKRADVYEKYMTELRRKAQVSVKKELLK